MKEWIDYKSHGTNATEYNESEHYISVASATTFVLYLYNVSVFQLELF